MLVKCRFLWLVSLFFASNCLVAADTIYNTIDNTFGDPVTHEIPKYAPTARWERQGCIYSCLTRIDPPRTFNRSWTAVTSRAGETLSIELNFQGISIEVYFILVNALSILHAPASTNVQFYLDDFKPAQFRHEPNGTTDILYNQRVFFQQGLTYGNHSLRISIPRTTHPSYVNFDYAVYSIPKQSMTSVPSVQSSSSPSSTPKIATNTAQSFPNYSSGVGTSSAGTVSGGLTSSERAGQIAGGILGGIAGVLVITIVVVILRRRRLRQDRHASIRQSVAGIQDGHTSEQALQTASLATRGSEGPASHLDHGASRLSSLLQKMEVDNLREERQRGILRQMRHVQKKVSGIEDQLASRSLTGIPNADPGCRDASTADMLFQLRAARGRMRILQAVQQSSWAQGHSDDPPGGFEQFSSNSRIDLRSWLSML